MQDLHEIAHVASQTDTTVDGLILLMGVGGFFGVLAILTAIIEAPFWSRFKN